MKDYKLGPGMLLSRLLKKSFFGVVEFDGLQGMLQETWTLPFAMWGMGQRVDFTPLVVIGLRY